MSEKIERVGCGCAVAVAFVIGISGIYSAFFGPMAEGGLDKEKRGWVFLFAISLIVSSAFMIIAVIEKLKHKGLIASKPRVPFAGVPSTPPAPAPRTPAAAKPKPYGRYSQCPNCGCAIKSGAVGIWACPCGAKFCTLCATTDSKCPKCNRGDFDKVGFIG
jgi:hypothetical protein